MPAYLTSGSAFERLALCQASAALPHADHETEYSREGTMVHEFLQGVSEVGREEALRLIDEPEDRAVCEALILDGLDEQLSLAAEVAIAYDFETDTARELGRGQGRLYHDVKETELPATLDVVGSRRVAAGHRGLVIDWKRGWTTRRRIAVVQQLDVGALLSARAFGFDFVEVQLIHVHEDLDPWVQRRLIDGWEIDAFAASAREIYLRALDMRQKMHQGIRPTEWNTGPWCDRCQAREWCDAQTNMLRAVLNRDMFDGERRLQHLDDTSIAQLWHNIHEAESVLAHLKGKVLGIASTRMVPLGRDPEDGKDRWLGKQLYEGNTELNGEVVFDVVAELHGEDAATAATKVTSTRKSIKAAIKQAVPRGKRAEAERAILRRLKEAGGSKRRWKTSVREFRTKPGVLPILAPPEGEADAEE